MGRISIAFGIAKSAWRSQHAIKPFSINLAALISVLVVPLQQAQLDPEAFLPWLWISLVAQIPTHGAVYAMWFLTYRKREQPAWLIFLIGLIAGAVRGSLVFFLGTLFVSGGDELSFTQRLIPASLSWMITIASLALVNYLVFVPNEGWRRLQVELAELEQDVENVQEQLDWLIARRRRGLDEELRRDFVALSQRVKELAVPQSEAFALLAAELRRFARESVRQRSIEIWRGKAPATPLVRAAWQSITNNPLPVTAALWVYVSGFVLSEMREREFLAGLLLSLLATTGFALQILLARRFSGRLFGRLKLPLIALIQATFVVLVLDIQLFESQDQAILPGFLAAAIWSFTSLFGAGWFTIGARLYQTEIRDLRERRDNTEQQLAWLQSRLETSNREIAKHLHGVVQSRLMAHAMNLENRGKLGQTVDLDLVIRELEPLISLESVGGATQSLDTEVQLLQLRWRGAVELEIETNCGKSREAVTETIQLLQEAVNNSLKHGRADRARISIQESAGKRLITVVDNGSASSEPARGLGTEIFDSICRNRWKLDLSPQGATLRCELDLSAHVSV